MYILYPHVRPIAHGNDKTKLEFMIEGEFGQVKRGYGLNDIRARLFTTANN